MDSEHILKCAREMFSVDHKKEIEANGVLKPSKNASPLWPPWSPAEYEAMERDNAKYFLYYSAINAAMMDIKEGDDSRVDAMTFTCLVLGPGRGRLIDYCLDCLSQNKLIGIVHVIDANVGALRLIRERYEDDNRVIIHDAIIIRDYDEMTTTIEETGLTNAGIGKLIQDKNVDLMVSELFGSIADNEFMPEILDTAVKLFASEKKCVRIPQKYTTYLTPVYSETLEDFCSTENSQECIYILGLPADTKTVSEPNKVYENYCDVTSGTLTGEFQLALHRSESVSKIGKQEGLTDECGHGATSSDQWTSQFPLVTGLAGHFTAILYGDIYIDTRPVATRNTYFWESAFFPFDNATKRRLGELTALSYVADKTHAASRKQESRKRKHSPPVYTVKLTRHVNKQVGTAAPEPRSTENKQPRPAARRYSLWYEWSVTDYDGIIVGKTHNSNGECHRLHL